MHCFEEGRVSNLVTSGDSTCAVVHDGDSHKARLRRTHSILEGECDCEASGGIDFCQHCVAVAFALQERHSPKNPVAKRRAMTSIRRHLSELSREALLDAFMNIVARDRSLRDDLFQKVQFITGALSYADLKDMITGIEFRGDPADFREVRAFFEEFGAFLLRINEYVDHLDPLVLLRAVEYAVQRFNAQTRFIDDYGDFSDTSMELLFGLHRAAVKRLDWQPADLASYLVDRYLSENWHPVQSGADLYVADLGDTFHSALLSEIDRRLAAVTSSDSAESESVRDELEALRVCVADVENG
jgi:hypothetical protein